MTPPDPGRRDRLLSDLMERARADPAVIGAALTGSLAAGTADPWSDIDLVLGTAGPHEAVLADWTDLLTGRYAAVHHWDLPLSRPGAVRVFLLPGGPEVDLTVVPGEEFGARGPQWRTLFGRDHALEPFAEPDPDTLIGLAWHHALHARTCVERGRIWQAVHWIGALRTQAIALACRNRGLPAAHAKGAHLLPPEVLGPLAASLPADTSREGLLQPLAALADLLIAEIAAADPGLARRLASELARAAKP
ncbi:nucleotidyltransferase domain-containing protein [Nocardiopsis changdeensis]|uniref:Nucleotidyltransferase domain-containing protein n=1 Tax=Nocardiopsis changdeensis TaxID=2831969 RepID=A0ABX8BJ18_9ACTN|nr:MULTISPECIES: nucleotidyltransferase domain-containing protein [Nocardiopsis]QUX21314.1 nucleotidyltransferase domain-containing protein [Nocardiopsis changdeensis]QYX37245.1 nucleotidyltransferase domain-containing protein [Nocardiopsis sp. MT53]